jgi:hypothetical protein
MGTSRAGYRPPGGHVGHVRSRKDKTAQRIDLSSARSATPFIRSRERADFAWASVLTRIRGALPDPIYTEPCDHFTEKESADPTWAVIAINRWYRAVISFCFVPGSCQPKS